MTMMLMMIFGVDNDFGDDDDDDEDEDADVFR